MSFSSNLAPPEFKILWRDQEYGLTVLVHERRESRHLVTSVFCADAGQLNKLAVPVALVGAIDDMKRHQFSPQTSALVDLLRSKSRRSFYGGVRRRLPYRISLGHWSARWGMTPPITVILVP
jgi:hypothetical protein